MHTGHEIQKTRDPTWEERKRNSQDDGEERSQSTVNIRYRKLRVQTEAGQKAPGEILQDKTADLMKLNIGSNGKRFSWFSGKFIEN